MVLAFGLQAVAGSLGSLQEYGGIIGTCVSAGFLYLIGNFTITYNNSFNFCKYFTSFNRVNQSVCVGWDLQILEGASSRRTLHKKNSRRVSVKERLHEQVRLAQQGIVTLLCCVALCSVLVVLCCVVGLCS